MSDTDTKRSALLIISETEGQEDTWYQEVALAGLENNLDLLEELLNQLAEIARARSV